MLKALRKLKDDPIYRCVIEYIYRNFTGTTEVNGERQRVSFSAKLFIETLYSGPQKIGCKEGEEEIEIGQYRAIHTSEIRRHLVLLAQDMVKR